MDHFRDSLPLTDRHKLIFCSVSQQVMNGFGGIFGEVGRDPRTNQLRFGGDPDQHLNPAFLGRNWIQKFFCPAWPISLHVKVYVYLLQK